MNSKIIIRKIISYSFLAVVILYVVTGFGITKSEIVEKISLGILSKPLSFKIHSNLIIPLIVFTILHIYFSCNLERLMWRKKKRN